MINVQILNNAAFVWNEEEMRILREKYRILGSSIGFTPKTFKINLPFILMPVEVQILKEKKIIKLYKVDSSTPPSQEKISRFIPKLLGLIFMIRWICFRVFEHQKQSYQTQIDKFKEEKIARIQSMADKIVEGKRKKQLQGLRKKRKIDDNDELIPEPIIDKELVINQEIASIKPITRSVT